MIQRRNLIPALFLLLAALMIAGAFLDAHFARSPSMSVGIYLHDTYYVISHTHIFLFLSLFFAGCGIVYFAFWKLADKEMDVALGQVHFWLSFFSIAVLFYAIYRLQAARPNDAASFQIAARSSAELGFAGMFGFLAGQIMFVVNVIWSFFHRATTVDKKGRVP